MNKLVGDVILLNCNLTSFCVTPWDLDCMQFVDSSQMVLSGSWLICCIDGSDGGLGVEGKAF